MATLEVIQEKIKKLQGQADAIISKKAQSAVDQIRKLMIQHGLTTEDIEARAKAKRTAKLLGTATVKALPGSKRIAKVRLRYRNPETGVVWSGYGRAPAWLADVKDRAKFLIDDAAGTATPGATPEKRARAKKLVEKKVAAKKVALKKVTAKTVAAKKVVAKKVVAKKAAAKKAVTGKAGN